MSQDFYLGNPNLKKVGTEIQFTKEQIQEYLRCKEDPVYFAMNYIKIISLDEGIVPFKMWDFQQELIESFHENRFNIAKLPRQTGKSTTCVLPFTLCTVQRQREHWYPSKQAIHC